MFWLFFALAVVGVLAIAYGLWALSEDSRARRKTYEEDVDTAAELLLWLSQNRDGEMLSEHHRLMAMPRKRPVIKSRHSTTL